MGKIFKCGDMDEQRIAMILNTKDSNDPEYKAANGALIPVREDVKDLGVWNIFGAG